MRYPKKLDPNRRRQRCKVTTKQLLFRVLRMLMHMLNLELPVKYVVCSIMLPRTVGDCFVKYVDCIIM